MFSPALTAARSGARGGFDAARFKRAFRAAAIRRGIDPAAGSTSYQAANLRAELRKAAQRRANRRFRQPIWWTDPALWLPCPPYRSSAEKKALERLFLAAYRRARRRAQLECIRDLDQRSHRPPADADDRRHPRQARRCQAR